MKSIFFLLTLVSFFVTSSSTSTTLEKTPSSPTFKTVQIGDQVWMAENLSIAVAGSRCYFSKYHQRNDCSTYGRYYTWEAARNAEDQIDGWRLPTNEDFKELLAALGGERNACTSLRENGSSGFEAKPAGRFVPITVPSNEYYGSDVGDFESALITAFFWSTDSAPYRSRKSCFILSKYGNKAEVGNSYDKVKLSVRLIKE